MKKRQTNYKERSQLEERVSLGALEKKRHFLARSKIEKEREEKIQNIKKSAAAANSDEFHFFMHKYKRNGLRLIRKEKIYEKTLLTDLPHEKDGDQEKKEAQAAERIVFVD